jgi:hypothetical protein
LSLYNKSKDEFTLKELQDFSKYRNDLDFSLSKEELLAQVAKLNIGVDGTLSEYYQLLTSEIKALGYEGRTTE